MTAAKPKGLHARLLEACRQLPDVMERDQQRTQGAKYRYLNEAGVLPPVRQALLEQGLTAVASVTSVQRDQAPRVDKNGEVRPEQVVTVLVQVTITDPDTGDTLQVQLAGASIDRDGRGVASARTDALKGIRQALLIAADDPDSDHARSEPDPVTRDQVAAAARDLGYTDEQRDLVLAAEARITPAAKNLAAVRDDQLPVALDVLRDPRALTWAQSQTRSAA